MWTTADKIKLASWYGMCPYGITNINDNRSYMMFLEREEREAIYEAVDWGCSVKAVLVENDAINYKGEKISINEFATRLNLQQPSNIQQSTDKDITINDFISKNIKIIYIFLFIGVMFVLVTVLIRTKKKIS